MTVRAEGGREGEGEKGGGAEVRKLGRRQHEDGRVPGEVASPVAGRIDTASRSPRFRPKGTPFTRRSPPPCSLLPRCSQVKLYEGVGFKLLGPSDVCHGSEPWMELSLVL